MRKAKTLIRLGRCPGWPESSLGAPAFLLVLSWGGSFVSNLAAFLQVNVNTTQQQGIQIMDKDWFNVMHWNSLETDRQIWNNYSGTNLESLIIHFWWAEWICILIKSKWFYSFSKTRIKQSYWQKCYRNNYDHQQHTCDKFQRGIRESFFLFQGDLWEMYRKHKKNLHTDRPGNLNFLGKTTIFSTKIRQNVVSSNLALKWHTIWIHTWTEL